MSATCSSCGASIVWVVTATGKRMPIDPQPVEGGNLELEGNRGGHVARYVKPEQGGLFGRPRYVSHFASCPHAAQHRKPTE